MGASWAEPLHQVQFRADFVLARSGKVVTFWPTLMVISAMPNRANKMSGSKRGVRGAIFCSALLDCAQKIVAKSYENFWYNKEVIVDYSCEHW